MICVSGNLQGQVNAMTSLLGLPGTCLYVVGCDPQCKYEIFVHLLGWKEEIKKILSNILNNIYETLWYVPVISILEQMKNGLMGRKTD